MAAARASGGALAFGQGRDRHSPATKIQEGRRQSLTQVLQYRRACLTKRNQCEKVYCLGRGSAAVGRLILTWPADAGEPTPIDLARLLYEDSHIGASLVPIRTPSGMAYGRRIGKNVFELISGGRVYTVYRPPHLRWFRGRHVPLDNWFYESMSIAPSISAHAELEETRKSGSQPALPARD